MRTNTTRLSAGAIALLASIAFAEAQPAPSADPHHPDTQAQGGKPAKPMTPPPGRPAGPGMAGDMMGGNMEHMMPMMREMMGPMMRTMAFAPDHLLDRKDVLALTKLNYNACMFADGMPVTIRFADAVGEILTAAPDVEKRPLPFKYYI